MKITACEIPGVLLMEPLVFGDARGFFFESFNQRAFRQHTGLEALFVQENHSHSTRNVLRGLHYQVVRPQGKLVRVVAGEVFDVVVDLRRSSSTFGRWMSHLVSASNRRQLWLPPGMAHGFLTLSDSADLLYNATDYYDAACERCIAWNDPTLGISWPLRGQPPLLSGKDQLGRAFVDAELLD